MSDEIQYYLSIASPWAYLGSARFIDLVCKRQFRVQVLPIDLDRVFVATGGLPFQKRSTQRRSYRQLELGRWSRHLAIPLTLEPRFYPVDRAPGSRLIIAARAAGFDVLSLSHAILRAIWAEERDISDRRTLAAIADGLGLPGEHLLHKAEAPATLSQFEEDTGKAIAAGVFGAPSYVIDGEIFWGQDRLQFVEKKLDCLASAPQ